MPHAHSSDHFSPRAGILALFLLSSTIGSCQKYEFTGPLTEEDRVGQGFYEFFFSENRGGTFFLFQVNRPGLKNVIYQELREKFVTERLSILQMHEADRRYERRRDFGDSVLVLIDPNTNRPGILMGITNIEFIGSDSADVSVQFSRREQVTMKKYILARENGSGLWKVVGFPDLIVHPGAATRMTDEG